MGKNDQPYRIKCFLNPKNAQSTHLFLSCFQIHKFTDGSNEIVGDDDLESRIATEIKAYLCQNMILSSR